MGRQISAIAIMLMLGICFYLQQFCGLYIILAKYPETVTPD